MTSIRSIVGAKLQPDPVTSVRGLAASVGVGGTVSLTQLLGVLATPVTFHSQITTPAGTALGGTVDLALFSNGRFTFQVHMHDSGFDPYTFRVRCAVQAPNGLTVMFQTSGHTDGTGSNLLGHVNRNFDHNEDAHNPMIQAYWLDIRQGSISVGKSYEDAGALHTIEEIAKDLLGFLIADVTFGAGLALVIAASAEISMPRTRISLDRADWWAWPSPAASCGFSARPRSSRPWWPESQPAPSPIQWSSTVN